MVRIKHNVGPYIPFLPRDASAERGYEIAFVCLSVCLSVRPSVRSGTGFKYVGILRK